MRPEFVRFQSAVPNRRGGFPGVFGLANALARSGRLDGADHAWWRSSNDWADAAYPDPEVVQPGCYDATRNPGARAWFRASASELLTFTRGYLDLLDRHDVAWVQLRTTSPGRIVYEDDVQVIAAPYTQDEWPFPPRPS